MARFPEEKGSSGLGLAAFLAGSVAFVAALLSSRPKASPAPEVREPTKRELMQDVVSATESRNPDQGLWALADKRYTKDIFRETLRQSIRHEDPDMRDNDSMPMKPESQLCLHEWMMKTGRVDDAFTAELNQLRHDIARRRRIVADAEKAGWRMERKQARPSHAGKVSYLATDFLAVIDQPSEKGSLKLTFNYNADSLEIKPADPEKPVSIMRIEDFRDRQLAEQGYSYLAARGKNTMMPVWMDPYHSAP